MRIGINARFLIKNRLEGIGWYSYHILRHIVLNHPEHEYYFFFDRKPDPSFRFNDSVKLVEIFPPARHPLLWYIWFEWSIPRALKKYNIDVFFSPDGYCSLSTPIPQYITVHDLAYVHYPEHVPFFVRKYYQWFVPRQIAKARHIFAVSEATRKDLIYQFNLASDKISITYNGVREEFKSIDEDEKQKIRSQYTEGKNYFLYVGAIHPRKNVMSLIRAFEIFKERTSSDFKLVLIGRKAWMNKELELTVSQSHYKNDLLFLPYCDTSVLASLTAAAHYAVNPSYLEGFGVPVLEALYCDVPVMVSNRFSLPEVAGPGAIQFDPYRVQNLAEALVKSIHMEATERENRIQLGRIHRMRFNWSVSAEIIYSGLRSVSSLP